MKLKCYEQEPGGLYAVRDIESGKRIALDLPKEQAEEIVMAVNALPKLVKTLEIIRQGRITETFALRLSDTEMSAIAHSALVSTGFGKAVSPFAQQILAKGDE